VEEGFIMWNTDWKRVAFWSLLFFLWYTWPTEGQEKAKQIILEVEPRICEPPCSVKAIITVKPHPENYKLVLMWSDLFDARGVGSERYFSLNKDSPAEFSFNIKDLPKGGYYVLALVYRGRKGTPFAESDAWVYAGVDPPK
jgi:hypothetical protein